MKKFMLMLALICTFSHAGTVATANNYGGGLIVLTDVKCSGKEGLVAYTNEKTGKTMMGCWFPEDSFIFITWGDGDIRTYPYDIFTVKPKKGQTL